MAAHGSSLGDRSCWTGRARANPPR